MNKRAFTIVEILLVLSLVALTAGLFAVNFDIIYNSITEKSPPQLIKKAFRIARVEAINQFHTVKLTFDSDSKELVLSRLDDSPLHKLPVDSPESVEFSLYQPILMPAKTFEDQKKEIVTQLFFYSDGSTSPAEIVLEYENKTLVYRIDPFSSNLVPAT